MKTIRFKNGATMKIVQDEDPMSPREWDTNIGLMLCFHTHYDLGDKHNYKSKDFGGWNALRSQIEKDHDVVAILPLYLFDHSGLSIAADDTTFRALDREGWDWRQIGFIVATKDSLKLGGRPGRVDTEKTLVWLQSEVESYNQYLRGDVYGFVIQEPPTHCDSCGHDAEGEEIDSCWGFYGNDVISNGMVDHIPSEYAEAIRGGDYEED